MTISERLRQISPSDFASLGLQGVAYIKPVVVDGATAYSIFAANGTQMGTVPTPEHALVALHERELDLVSVH